MAIFNSYVSLPEGNQLTIHLGKITPDSPLISSWNYAENLRDIHGALLFWKQQPLQQPVCHSNGTVEKHPTDSLPAVDRQLGHVHHGTWRTWWTWVDDHHRYHIKYTWANHNSQIWNMGLFWDSYSWPFYPFWPLFQWGCSEVVTIYRDKPRFNQISSIYIYDHICIYISYFYRCLQHPSTLSFKSWPIIIIRMAPNIRPLIRRGSG